MRNISLFDLKGLTLIGKCELLMYAAAVPGLKHRYINPLVPSIGYTRCVVECSKHQTVGIADG
jgi:hypothetical protein